MSTFGDYKLYKQYEPVYPKWRSERNLLEAKRQEYVKQNPEIINEADIKKGRALIRAIDIMDEYSQKRAENMEVATESIVGSGLELTMLGGAALGGLFGSLKPVQKLMCKFIKGQNPKKLKLLSIGIPAVIGAMVGTLAAFPLYAWAAKAEVGASRKGRFEAMRKELSSPNGFAVLTEEQNLEALKRAQNIQLEEDKKHKLFNIGGGLASLKDMAIDSKEYKRQRKEFELALAEEEQHYDDKLTDEQILDAKKDQQLLTKLVDKIDIASQDYAENAELAAGILITGILGCGALGDLILNKALTALKVKSAPVISVITKVLTLAAGIGASIFSAQISKQASRVGRFKAKQELLNNPTNFVYVDNKDASNLQGVEAMPEKKQGFVDFLKEAWKNNEEYNKYVKGEGKDEKRFFKAIETLELTPEQIKDAKRLQKNTFKTFNKIDENSQKYSESIEALGQAAAYPIILLFSMAGAAIGVKYLSKSDAAKNSVDKISNLTKYMLTILLSTVPATLINAYITKEQKNASRVANMLTINEMKDYRAFADYTKE